MTLVSILLKASILVTVTALIDALIGKRLSAAARHFMWTLAAAGLLLLLPALSFVLPAWTAFTAPVPDFRLPTRTLQDASVVSPDPSQSVITPEKAIETQGTPRPAAPARWPGVISVFYGAVVFLLLVRLILEHASTQRLRRRATEISDAEWTRLLSECAEAMQISQTVRLLRSREETMPMAIGIRQRAILVPAVADMWTEDRRRAVLRHEMAHLVRHDCLTQMLASLACSLYWIHPGVWWMERRLRIERELACDDRVLSSGTNGSEYAGHLLELAYSLRSGKAPALAVCMTGSGQLENRMRALLDAARNRAIPALRSHIAGLTILAALLIPLAAVTISVRRVSSSELTRIPLGQSLLSKVTRAALRIPDPNTPGTWEVHSTDRPRIVQVHLREGDSSYSRTIDLDKIAGLPAGFPGVDGPVQFNVTRDAGTFSVEGITRRGVGAGTYAFTPNETFAAGLARRGFERPSPGELRVLARADVGFAYLDELAAQHYSSVHLADLVNAAYHGITLSYLQGMKRLGYHVDSLDSLIDLAGKGISPDFIEELTSEGLRGLALSDFVRARNSGVDVHFVRDLRNLGYPNLSLDTLIQLRQHGVDPDYARELAAIGYDNLSLETLIQLRNHGVDPDFARQLTTLGYARLTLDSLIELRNHGVDPVYIKEMKSLGYTQLPLYDFVRMRNSGISQEQVRDANARARTRLSVDDLVALASRGWR